MQNVWGKTPQHPGSPMSGHCLGILQHTKANYFGLYWCLAEPSAPLTSLDKNNFLKQS